MIDNHFIIFMSATYNLAYPIVNHCRTLSFKKTRGLVILYLTTIVTMLDNLYNIHECNI